MANVYRNILKLNFTKKKLNEMFVWLVGGGVFSRCEALGAFKRRQPKWGLVSGSQTVPRKFESL